MDTLREWDLLVAGLGAFGSAALDRAAARGLRVLGLDRFDPPHDHGSTHGRTRIIREAYFESPFYVPLVRRAFDRWDELEADAGRPLLSRSGGLMVGPVDGPLVRGTLASVREHRIPHEQLGAGELRRRFPGLAAREEDVGVLEPRAGVLRVEDSLRALRARALSNGALVRSGESLEGWRADRDGVTVVTSHRSYRTGALVLALGPWLGDHLGAEFGSHLEVERQTSFWFRGDPVAFRTAPAPGAPGVPGARGPGRSSAIGGTAAPPPWPVLVWEPAPGRILYTLPDLGDGFKAGIHHEGSATHPDRVRREVTPADERAVRELVDRILPGAAGPRLDGSVCLYTNTPDHDFLVGPHPDHPRVVLAGGGSGHGFKFAPVIGELAVNAAMEAIADAAGAAGAARGPGPDALPCPASLLPARLRSPGPRPGPA